MTKEKETVTAILPAAYYEFCNNWPSLMCPFGLFNPSSYSISEPHNEQQKVEWRETIKRFLSLIATMQKIILGYLITLLRGGGKPSWSETKVRFILESKKEALKFLHFNLNRLNCNFVNPIKSRRGKVQMLVFNGRWDIPETFDLLID